MFNSNNKNNGITLIALVITIIVMLILVAVTITIAVNGGLFNYAREAGTKTNAAKDLEQNYANIPSGWTYENLIDKYAVKEIQFTYTHQQDEEPYTVTVQYSAREGMTWKEWVQSDYSKKYPDLIWTINSDETEEWPSCGSVCPNGDILGSELIINGAHYIGE